MFKMFSTIALFGLITVSAAHAQMPQPVKADIPFAFEVQHKLLSPGTYRFTYSNGGFLYVQHQAAHAETAIVLAKPDTDPQGTSGSPRLVFECYDNTCFLDHVWQGTLAAGEGLQVSRPRSPERRLSLLTRVVTITIAGGK
jgi:hypothetical protein